MKNVSDLKVKHARRVTKNIKLHRIKHATLRIEIHCHPYFFLTLVGEQKLEIQNNNTAHIYRDQNRTKIKVQKTRLF